MKIEVGKSGFLNFPKWSLKMCLCTGREFNHVEQYNMCSWSWPMQQATFIWSWKTIHLVHFILLEEEASQVKCVTHHRMTVWLFLLLLFFFQFNWLYEFLEQRVAWHLGMPAFMLTLVIVFKVMSVHSLLASRFLFF